MRRLALLALALAAPLTARAQTRGPADLVVTNARIYTVDDTRPVVAAMAVRDGKVLFTGSEREAMALRGANTRVVDAGGRTVIPGMVDAHAHLLGLGQALRQVDLVGAKSYDEVVARVAAAAKGLPAGNWLLGRGWDQNDWGDTRFPTHDALTRAVPNNPVYLTRVDGHAGLANAAAMRAAGVTTATADPSGGRVERTATREPTGVFVDNAQGLVERVIPAPTREDDRSAIRAAIAESHRYGLVGVHDAGESRATIDRSVPRGDPAEIGRVRAAGTEHCSGDSRHPGQLIAAKRMQQSVESGEARLRGICQDLPCAIESSLRIGSTSPASRFIRQPVVSSSDDFCASGNDHGCPVQARPKFRHVTLS